MFSTTCSHLKSICVRAAAPLLMMSDTENIWRMPTRTSAMMVMARSTSTELLPRRARRNLSSAILTPRRGRGVPDLLDDSNAPDRVDAEHVPRRGLERAVDHVHVRQDERGWRADLSARRGGAAGFRGGGFRADRHRAPLEVTHEDTRHGPVRGAGAGIFVRPE